MQKATHRIPRDEAHSEIKQRLRQPMTPTIPADDIAEPGVTEQTGIDD